MSRWITAARAEGARANMECAGDIQTLARAIVAKRTGALAASIEVTAEGDDALVGPTGTAASKNGPYGRFHELGGEHHAHNPSGFMWWPTGVWSNHAAHQTKAPHPYLAPAVERVMTAGHAGRIYAEHWRKAQEAL